MDGVCHLNHRLGALKDMCTKVCRSKLPFMICTPILVKGSKGTKGWDSWGGAWMDGVSHLEKGPGATKIMCAKVWCKTPFMMLTSTLVKGSKGT